MRMKTPDDLAFVTFDELSVSDLFTPAITTIVQPAFQIGFRACEILLGRINGAITKDGVLNECLPATLNVRESSRGKVVRTPSTGNIKAHGMPTRF
jgi:DNA-binding LacI/PurR family transcriptional regulator